jgi:hypothetical protein
MLLLMIATGVLILATSIMPVAAIDGGNFRPTSDIRLGFVAYLRRPASSGFSTALCCMISTTCRIFTVYLWRQAFPESTFIQETSICLWCYNSR